MGQFPGAGFSGVGGGGVLEPWVSSDFLEKSWENPEPSAKSWESSAGNSGNLIHLTASFAGAPITRGWTLAAVARAKRGKENHETATNEKAEKYRRGWVPDQGAGPACRNSRAAT